MKAVLQRVSRAKVTVAGHVTGEIGCGLLVLLGVAQGDTSAHAARLAARTANLRVFRGVDDGTGSKRPMDLSVKDVGGAVLVVSQFTLLADCLKGRRPDFTAAARPDPAKELYELYMAALSEQGLPVAAGEFGASMQVELLNDGPVTILLEE